MPSQYFDTANHKKFQCDFAFKADQVPMLQTPDQAKICVNCWPNHFHEHGLKFNFTRLITCQCYKHLIKSRFVSIIDM
jgi:hypothetical protein